MASCFPENACLRELRELATLEKGWGGEAGGSSLLEMGAERKGRAPQVVCYRPGGGTGGLELEGRRESKGLKIICHPPWLQWPWALLQMELKGRKSLVASGVVYLVLSLDWPAEITWAFILCPSNFS